MLFSLKNIIIEIGIRYSLYKQISYFLFFITTSSIILKITIGYFIGSSTIYLFYSETIALFFLITIAFVQLNKEKLKIFIPQKIQIISAIKKNKSFIKYDIITSLINISSWMLPGIILGYYFNSNVVGHYALAFSMLKLPMKLIGNNIGMVFYKESSNNISETISLKDKSMKLVITLLLSSGLPVILFFFYSIDLFSIVFGIDWKEAGNFAKILSIWTLFWLLSSPISNLYYTLGLQPQFLGFMIISIILRFSGLVVGGINNDVFLALFLYSFISSLVYIFQIFYLFKKISIPFIATINLFLYSFLIFVPFIIIIYLLSLLNNIYLGITFSILIVILFYYITVQYRLINLISSKCI
jgi:O-antigen/teichoic acid export membrane protein